MFAASASALAFAGCVGTSDATPNGAGPAPAEPAFDDQTGSVHGLVQNDELLPIVGAQVGIPSANIVAVTDEGGAYALNYVPPGTQNVAVLALGYESTTKKVDVVAGQVVDHVDFVLTSIPVGPYHSIGIFKLNVGGYMFKLTPDCMYPVPGQATYKTCVGGSLCNTGPCEVHYGHCKDGGSYGKYGCDLTPEWKTIIGEVQWVPQSSVTGRGWIFEVLAPNVTRANADSGSVDQSDKHDFMTLSSKSPIRTWVDDAAMEARKLPPTDRCGGKAVESPNCDWVWRIFPGWCTIGGLTGGLAGCEKTGPDFDIDTGNPVNVYFSYFIGEPAPNEFSAVPDH